jgi:drug/metabolite transporter (DMT)-like permease
MRVFAKRPAYWLLAGGVGFGVFYAGICFASVHAPGWMVAATWQSTILATPLVLRAMGQRVPLRGVAAAAVIFVGLLLITAQPLIDGVTAAQWRLGVLPVLVAAFAYPFGNQLLNRAQHATDADADTAAVLADPVASVLLLTLGALPFLALLVLTDLPPLPTAAQVLNTLIVALVAGVIATTLFLYARNLSAEPYRIAAVDATQGGEVVFALLGEMLLLGAPAPSPLACFGLALMLCGLVGFALGGSGGKQPSH